MNNILVIKLRYIGDVLLATPVLRALRERFPEARLTMAVNRGTEDILKSNSDVDEVLAVGWSERAAQLRFLHELRRRRFDVVIDLTDGDRSAIMAKLSGTPVRIGFNEEHRWRGLLYTSVVRVQPGVVHRVERDLEALRPLGIEPKPWQPVLRISSQDEAEAARLLHEVGIQECEDKAARPLAMLVPGARYWFKAWPVERFAELANRLVEVTGCHVLVGGDLGERELGEAIRGQSHVAVTVLAGRTSLRQLAAILKRCALFVGNDNGPMHMAAAVGTPVVALFGPSDPTVWGPRGSHCEVLYKGLDCRQCFHPTCTRGEESCMKLISIDEVFAAAQRVITSRFEVVRDR